MDELLLQDKELNEKVKQAKNADEVVALFAEKGVDVPKEIAQELFEPAEINESELDEEDLEAVSGGGIFGSILGGGVAYLIKRLKGMSKAEAAKAAIKWGIKGWFSPI